jgi:hypothetical protein
MRVRAFFYGDRGIAVMWCWVIACDLGHVNRLIPAGRGANERFKGRDRQPGGSLCGLAERSADDRLAVVGLRRAGGLLHRRSCKPRYRSLAHSKQCGNRALRVASCKAL